MSVETETGGPGEGFVPIECDYLDGENVAWAKRYVEACQAKLEGADARFGSFLRREIAAYQELLRRFEKA